MIWRTQGARGFSMLFAIGLIAALSVSAAILMQQSGNLGIITASLYRNTKTASAARDGARAGAAALTNLLYPGGSSTMTLANVLALPALQAGDRLCADGVTCSNWRLLQAAQPVGTEGATCRIAVTCNPSACTSATNKIVNFQVRSLGALASGDVKLVELTLVPAGS